MAVANTNTGWVNSDGLRVKFPAEEVLKGNAGEYNYLSSTHWTEYDVDYIHAALGLSQTNPYILSYDTVFPDTAVIEKIEFVTGTAWATDTSLDFGFVKRSDFTTIVDADGLLVAFLLANRNLAGETTVVTAGATFAGALVGVQAGIGFDSVVSVNWNGAAPTAGTGTLRIYWRNGPVTVST